MSKTYWLSKRKLAELSKTMKLSMLIIVIDINRAIRKCFSCALEIHYHSEGQNKSVISEAGEIMRLKRATCRYVNKGTRKRVHFRNAVVPKGFSFHFIRIKSLRMNLQLVHT